jgi:hypothetical protein
MIVSLGLEHHLASANPNLSYRMNPEGAERLLYYYDALAALNVVVNLFPCLVLLPGLVVGFFAFSVNCVGALKDTDFTAMKGGILHVSQLEERIYSAFFLLLLIGWITIVVFVQGPFRGLMIKFGVPDSAGQFSESR